MARHDDKVAKLYEERRVHPRNQPHDGRHPSPHRAANQCEPHWEVQQNQFPEDAHGPGYNNDVKISDWKRNGRAESKPSYDDKNVWRGHELRDQIKDRHADHNRHHSEFEIHHNAGTTHAQGAYDHDFSKRHVPNYEKKGELGFKDSAPKHKGPWLKDKQ